MTRFFLGSALLAASFAALSVPAAAQKIQRYVEVYGDDACPIGSDNEIVVCAKKPESDRYRIPEHLRQPSNSPDAQTWASRSESVLTAGESGSGSRGTGTCSTSGANGWTGCWAQEIAKTKAANKAAAKTVSEVP